MDKKFYVPNIKLDKIDRHILSLLHENSRISYTDIGKEIGISRVAVQTRVNTLFENGIIEKFTTVINPAKVGKTVSAFFNVDVEPQYLESVANTLADDPAVTSLYHMTGPSKLHMHGIFIDNQEMESFLTNKLYAIKGVVSVDCQILIKRYKSRIGMKL
ncbi:Lrp/AsnC family transcriptional regulator [Cytobacillus oceanisediminis]|jgi:DNA-binding Lrp family transcriptional regulator|uniref:Lrp/AsnC family transcriptional regulator n=1 Tax=Niallia alba TaxID=2729105 RepID=A0A7Y0PNJ3_9BACI|nr:MULTISPECIES: Lrp/AsnC family transcriptional regulator [Bacillaceae]EOR24276.1 AsnC family transcriptional regulator [Niallia nealsonii AAU1]MBQ6446841.1 Lrp/AsnC family transcriptional regulator [Bacillus sp. (in: firmicutes)]MDU1846091.1 Lrp/AsnC family transcriptional regulator [Niallia nealsonii]MBZ9534007.1 Lrp/AsnC family transcriptional regulator [Cytobacillus oceanisediminis]MED3794176.1 Lrp/AsnC family transcriptional regulator [Niallia alba]